MYRFKARYGIKDDKVNLTGNSSSFGCSGFVLKNLPNLKLASFEDLFYPTDSVK